ncbi:hypothetical protein [Megasphaera sp. DISK 18]|uniref:hypothetical protein n=1 Tax=Megasphaera sp. DISK 18 TaxID=1776081 RepID=UPI0008070F68|nr:hypothetical protein [Megasphaera sp. DISK 18]OBZ33133.1 hypothetical protein A0U42_01000 [Megasphaera sp. DISK 18]
MKIRRLFPILLTVGLMMTAGVAFASHTAGLQPTQGTRVFFEKPQKESVPALSNKAIESELQMTASQQKETSYYYHYVDLNNDGITDALVLAVGPYTSGSGGNTMFWLSPDTKGKWQMQQKWTLVHTPVMLTGNDVNGYKGIVVRRAGGGATPAWILLTYQNGQYTTVNDGIILPFSTKK